MPSQPITVILRGRWGDGCEAEVCRESGDGVPLRRKNQPKDCVGNRRWLSEQTGAGITWCFAWAGRDKSIVWPPSRRDDAFVIENYYYSSLACMRVRERERVCVFGLSEYSVVPRLSSPARRE